MKEVRIWNGHFLLQKRYFTLATENEQLKSSARPNFIRKFNKSITLTDWALPAYSLQTKITFNSSGKIFQPFFCVFVCGWDGGGAAEVPVGKDLFALTGNHPFARQTNSCIFWRFFFSLETFWKRELLCTDSHLKEQLIAGG